MFKRILLIFALAVLSFSCGFPSEQRVKDEFASANPTLKPVYAGVGEGHEDAAYYHIRYKKPNDDKTYEQIWLYLRQDNGNIQLTNRGKETIVDE